MSWGKVVAAFTVLNFVLAGLWLLFVLMLLAMLVSCLGRLYGAWPSPDPNEDLLLMVYGCIGMITLYAPGIAAFSAAGVGLMRGKDWGFYSHLIAALLAAVSCFGVVYTVIAVGFALQPGFRGALLAKGKERDNDLQELPA